MLYVMLVLFSIGETVTAILAMVGVTPIQAIALVYNFIMGRVSVPIVNWLKTVLGKIPFIPSDEKDRIGGWFVPVISTAVGLLFVYVGQWTFGLSFFENPSIYTNLITALGLNATVGQMFFEIIKSKKNKAAVQ